MPPRASNQVSLWRKGDWVASGTVEYKHLGDGVAAQCVFHAIKVVDQAILKMMEKGDE